LRYALAIHADCTVEPYPSFTLNCTSANSDLNTLAWNIMQFEARSIDNNCVICYRVYVPL